ncbi:MAG: NTP transferase domain-containing protein [Candidatus Izemoplasmatales bacterium]
MTTIAVMPIKLNNERLPGKNTMLLGGKPLLQHELDTLKAIDLVDRIDVFCSQESVKEYLPRGVNFVQRPTFLDSPSTNFTQIFQEYLNIMDADIFVYAHATAPFITSQTMRECIQSVQSGAYDSAFCATKIQDFLWKDGQPINFDATNMPRSQDLDVIYRETSGIYVFRREVFEKYRRRIGEKPFIKEVTFKEAIDINDRYDYLLAQHFVNIDI